MDESRSRWPARGTGQRPSVPRGGTTGISIDTRTLGEGELFFAIKGANSDGHDYAAAAFEKGAVAAVVDEAHAERSGRSDRSMS